MLFLYVISLLLLLRFRWNLSPILVSIVCMIFIVSCRNRYYSGNVLIDGNYFVSKSHTPSENETIIQLLKELRKRATRLVELVKEEHPSNRIVRSWNGHIHELGHEYIKEGIFAYNVNKGESISVCMHDTQKKLNNINDLFFVTMHEMAHIMTEAFEHNEEFWNSFRLLIQIATKHKLYEHMDYDKNPSSFCGDYIDHNPNK